MSGKWRHANHWSVQYNPGLVNKMGDSPGPLAGISVLDLATERAELAGRILADLGANVTKIEPPGGSAARFIPPFEAGADEQAGESSLYWAAVALGKRSIVVDLTTDEGRAQVRGLATAADILVESFDPGTMTAHGLGYEQLSALNLRLVYISVTPWGQSGPHADRAATELTIEAASGLLGLQGDRDRPPVPVGYPQAAFHAGAQAAADAIIALNERQQSGRGQHLDVSTQAAMVWTLMNATGYPPNTGGDPPNSGEGRTNPPLEIAPGVVFPNVWRSKDGWVQATITLGGLGARTLGNLIRLIEAEGQLSPERTGIGWAEWVDAIELGRVPAEILTAAREEIANYLASHTGEEIMRRAVEHKLLVAPVRTIPDLLSSSQLQERSFWTEVAGRLHPGAAVKLSRTPMQLTAAAPRLGQHQDSFLPQPAPPGERAARSSGAKRQRAFSGLKVADFAWVGVGPLIAKALADHGATVVHIESTTRPDVLRLGPPFKDGQPGLDRSQFFANFNSSKRGMALNLALPEGRELAERVIDWADVLIESFVPGVLEGLGFDYQALAARRPDLVMLSTCLCGQTGRDATYRGFGTQGAALSGLHGLTGWPDRPPAGTWGAYTDFIAPRYGIAALAAAIFERSRSGLGQYIDLGQVEAAVHFLEPLILDFTTNRRRHEAPGHRSDRACPHGVYRTAGAERYAAIAVETPGQWRALRSLAPIAQIASAEAGLPERFAVAPELDAALAAWCSGKDAWELVEQLVAAGVPASVVQRPSDLYADPQLAHRGFFVTCDHAAMGPTPYDGPATIFSETPAQLTAAPLLGQHTDEVLSEILHLDEDEIAGYAASGVFQ